MIRCSLIFLITSIVVFYVNCQLPISTCSGPVFAHNFTNCVDVPLKKCTNQGTFKHAYFVSSTLPPITDGCIFQGSWNYGPIDHIEIRLEDSGVFKFKFYNIFIQVDGENLFISDSLGNSDNCQTPNCVTGHSSSGGQVYIRLDLEIVQPYNKVNLILYVNGILVYNKTSNPLFILFTGTTIFEIVEAIDVGGIFLWNKTIYSDPTDINIIKNRTPDDIVCGGYIGFIITQNELNGLFLIRVLFWILLGVGIFIIIIIIILVIVICLSIYLCPGSILDIALRAASTNSKYKQLEETHSSSSSSGEELNEYD